MSEFDFDESVSHDYYVQITPRSLARRVENKQEEITAAISDILGVPVRIAAIDLIAPKSGGGVATAGLRRPSMDLHISSCPDGKTPELVCKELPDGRTHCYEECV